MSETSQEERLHDFLKRDSKVKLEMIENEIHGIGDQCREIYVQTGSDRAKEIAFILCQLRDMPEVEILPDNGMDKARQIVRHERSVASEPDIQQVLDRILKSMEEIEANQTESKGDLTNGEQEKTDSKS